jgi:hypothetical protein
VMVRVRVMVRSSLITGEGSMFRSTLSLVDINRTPREFDESAIVRPLTPLTVYILVRE